MLKSFIRFSPKFVDMTSTPPAKNVLGGSLQCCCSSPKTGYFRDGYCNTGPTDFGRHTVCAILTPNFLEYSKNTGNDLSTPRPEFDFPGLKPGDKWCLCAARWLDAYKAGCAPVVFLEATHEKTLEIIPKEYLLEYKANTNNSNENVNE